MSDHLDTERVDGTDVRRSDVVARTADLRGLRDELREWAAAVGLDAGQADDVALAGYEILVNVAEHAYPDELAGTFDVETVASATRAQVTVTDRGIGLTLPVREPTPLAPRGRGIALARALADHVAISTDTGGTAVTLAWDVHRRGGSASR